MGDEEITQSTLKMLLMKFPKSARVSRLRGIMAEVSGNPLLGKYPYKPNIFHHDACVGDYTEALHIYNEILKDQPGNLLAMKRKVG